MTPAPGDVEKWADALVNDLDNNAPNCGPDSFERAVFLAKRHLKEAYLKGHSDGAAQRQKFDAKLADEWVEKPEYDGPNGIPWDIAKEILSTPLPGGKE